MKRYSLSISKLHPPSDEKDFGGEYDTLEEVNAKIDEVYWPKKVDTKTKGC